MGGNGGKIVGERGESRGREMKEEREEIPI